MAPKDTPGSEGLGLDDAVELLLSAPEGVDLYGMDDQEAESYLRTHYPQVAAHDTLRLFVLNRLIDQGGAQIVAAGQVALTSDAVALLRKMARTRSLTPLRSHRPHRMLAKSLLREWEDAGVVRLSVLQAAPAPHTVEESEVEQPVRPGLEDSGGKEEVQRTLDQRARYIANHIVDAGLAERCDVDLAYVDGARLVLVAVHTFGTEMIPVTRIEALARDWLLEDV